MKILVIGGCSGKQKYNKLPNKLKLADFRSPDRLAQRMAELSEYKEPASEMYEGTNHSLLMEGLKSIREHDQDGKTVIDLYIISTGYGLISECDIIVPYDVKTEDAVWKQVPDCVSKKASEIINNDYDLVFFFLGKDLEALQLREGPFEVMNMVNWIFVVAPSHYNKLPSNFPSDRIVEAGEDLVDKLLGASNYNVRGFIFKKLCEAVCCDGFQLFENVKQNPQQIVDIVLRNS